MGAVRLDLCSKMVHIIVAVTLTLSTLAHSLPRTYEYILPGHSFVSINYGSPRSGSTISTFRNFDRSGSALRNELDRSGNTKNDLDRTSGSALRNELDRSGNAKNDLDSTFENKPSFSL